MFRVETMNTRGNVGLLPHQPLFVAPHPRRAPTWRTVVFNSDVRRSMQYTDEERQRGEEAEDLFARLGRKEGLEVVYSSAKDDFEHHIDFILFWPDGTSATVDVKARKKIQRSDKEVAGASGGEELVWLELHGAHAHNRGWLFDGKAEYVAFETKEQFVFFSRRSLAACVMRGDLVQLEEFVNTPSEARNKVYPRGKVLDNGKCDQVTLVSVSDLTTLYPESLFCVWNK